ncbi:hypothetical protein [Nocardia transvalensis]|uniref:hypothetical protein n=1 Tax=Nocardia transvalensis TaxID=37333 RepID=UPI00189327C5|nr:hypothetical protein [Nocardia transvalensis]MBF6328678.1 hypothetical protein [Nocardia transvalensis]
MRVVHVPGLLLSTVALAGAAACGDPSGNPLGLTPTTAAAASSKPGPNEALRTAPVDCGRDDSGYHVFALTTTGDAACGTAHAALAAYDSRARGADDLLVHVGETPWTCRSYEAEVPSYRECVNTLSPTEKAQRRSPRVPVGTPAPGQPQSFDIFCGTGADGLAVHAITTQDDAACRSAVAVTDAYAEQARRTGWNGGRAVSVTVNGVTWECRQQKGNPNPYQECVNGATPTEKATLTS